MRRLLPLLLLATPLPGAAQERPNILFVFSDDHAAHAVGAYGSVLNETPNIDRLATEVPAEDPVPYVEWPPGGEAPGGR